MDVLPILDLPVIVNNKSLKRNFAMTKDVSGALLIAPLLKRNDQGIIVDTFGDVSIPHQCVTIALTAHKKDSEGFTEEEAAHVTIPLLGCARVILEAWLAVVLPGWELHDWAVFCPCEDSADEPF